MSPDADRRPSAPLRLGVDALNLLHDRRGIGRYVRSLLRRWLKRDAARVEVVLLVPHLFPWSVGARLRRDLRVDDVRVERRARASRLGLDIAWHPWNGIFFDSGVRDVVTIHDVWPFVNAPAEDPALAQSRQQPFLRAAHQAAWFVTDSQFSKREVVRRLGVDPERIDVVYLGVDAPVDAARAAAVAARGRYLLFVGETEGRKDLSTLIAAVARLPAALRDGTALIVAGKSAASATVPNGVRIDFAGEVDDDTLAALYSGASAFVFPSQYEGFGLPVLEAMAYGAPVVASDAASIPEAAGDAALYFKAGDAGACAAAIERVLSEPGLADSMRERGRDRAAQMTWDRCADATLAILERVAGRAGRP